MSVKSRTFTTAILGMGIAFGLLLPGAVAHAQPEPGTMQEGNADAAGGSSADAGADTEAGADGNAGADPVETPDPEQPVDPADPVDPEPTDPEQPAGDAEGEPAPDSSDEEPITDGQGGVSDEEDPREPLAIAPLTAAATSSLSGFKLGYIISDRNFYDSSAMTAAQIQSFLNQRVPRCTIGDPGREAGSKFGNTRIAEKCLRDYTMSTASIGADTYCRAYAGRAGESAAQIISKVALSCGISPRVLLVLLQKEQSLVTDSWPTERQIAVAMGANCPDDGPNWSANCDPRYFGFQKQVHRAAWLLKYYKLNPTSYRYQAGVTVQIQYGPSPSCGSIPVHIENQATAALYIYTPYVPGGKGDGCVSSDKPNFYQFYKQWFGSPNSAFPDVPQGHQFFTEIEWMSSSGLTTGIKTADGRTVYHPKGKVTREAMAAFLYRLNGSPSVDTSKAPFADMKPGDSFYKEIVWMYNSGLSTGISQGAGKKPIYAPKDRVSREAMAAFIYRYKAAKYTGPATSPFADMKRGDKFYNEITWMRAEGLSTGISQGAGKKPIYAPKDRVSREAMAAFIYRLSN